MEKTLFSGIRFEVVELTEDNTNWQIIKHPGAVVILPYLDDDTLVLIRNKRHAIGGTLIELPAGTLEPGEKPKVCAGRELIEETGYEAKHLKPLFSCYSTPGFCNEKLHFFEARELTFVGQNLDENEEIEPLTLGLAEAKQWVHEGKITDMKTIAALFFSPS